MADNRKPVRKSLVPEPSTTDEENKCTYSDNLDQDKMDVDYVDEMTLKKRVLSKHKQYMYDLVKLLKAQEKQSKNQIIEMSDDDYINYLKPEDREFLEKIDARLENRLSTLKKIEEYKVLEGLLKANNKILDKNQKILNHLINKKAIKDSEMSADSFQLPIFNFTQDS